LYEDTLRLPQNLQAVDDVANSAAIAPKSLMQGLVNRVKGSRRVLGGLAFALGLLVGWLVLGWLVWPVKWDNTDPWDLRSQHQRHYLQLVAADYWNTGDMGLVHEALDGWDDEDLHESLASLVQSNDLSPESRQHAAVLADALDMSANDQPLVGSVFNSTGLTVAAGFCTLPLLLMVGLVANHLIRKGAPLGGGEAISVALAVADAEGQSQEEGESADAEGQSQEEGELAAAEEPPDGAVSMASSVVPGGLDAFDVTVEDDEGVKAFERSQTAAAEGGGGYQEGNSPEEARRETERLLGVGSEEDEPDLDVTDVLAGLFDEEEEGAERLQSLAKGLSDLPVDEIAKSAKDMVYRLVLMSSQRGHSQA